MTKKNPTTDLVDRLGAAQDAAKALAAELAETERAAHDSGEAAKASVWQRYLDGYDAADDRSAIVDASARLDAAIAETELGRALVGYVEALIAARTRHDLADAAIANGAQGHHPGIFSPRLENGKPLAIAPRTLLDTLLWDRVHAQARVSPEALAQTLEDQAAEAYASSGTSGPSHYRVTIENMPGIRTKEVGGVRIRFVNGTTYLPANSPALRYYSRRDAYAVTPVFAIPEDWAAASTQPDNIPVTETGDGIVKRPATAADAYRREPRG